ncbi:MAG: hypothetical protein AABW73_01500 [Nanoarchaeota archaeon]
MTTTDAPVDMDVKNKVFYEEVRASLGGKLPLSLGSSRLEQGEGGRLVVVFPNEVYKARANDYGQELRRGLRKVGGGEDLYLGVDKNMLDSGRRLASSYLSGLEEATNTEPAEKTVRIVVRPKDELLVVRSQTTKQKSLETTATKYQLLPKPETIMKYEGNNYAVDVTRRIAELASSPKEVRTNIKKTLIHGPNGAGKTALATTLCYSLAEAGMTPVYLDVPGLSEFLRHNARMAAAIAGMMGEQKPIMREYGQLENLREADLLVLDGIEATLRGEKENRPGVEAILRAAIDASVARNIPVLALYRGTGETLKAYISRMKFGEGGNKDLADRLEEFVRVPMHLPSGRERGGLMKDLLITEHGFSEQASQEISRALGENFGSESTLREIRGSVASAVNYINFVGGEKPDYYTLASKALKGTAGLQGLLFGKKVDTAELFKEIERRTGIAKASMTGRKGTSDVINARHAYAAIARKDESLGVSAIAKLLGKDHGTLNSAYERIDRVLGSTEQEKLSLRDKELLRLIKTLEEAKA